MMLYRTPAVGSVTDQGAQLLCSRSHCSMCAKAVSPWGLLLVVTEGSRNAKAGCSGTGNASQLTLAPGLPNGFDEPSFDYTAAKNTSTHCLSHSPLHGIRWASGLMFSQTYPTFSSFSLTQVFCPTKILAHWVPIWHPILGRPALTESILFL